MELYDLFSPATPAGDSKPRDQIARFVKNNKVTKTAPSKTSSLRVKEFFDGFRKLNFAIFSSQKG